MTYRVTTTPHVNGDIRQEVLFQSEDGVMKAVTEEIIRTKDAQICQALIALGWTPPA